MRCVVITINYRHAPEHPYPAAIDDSSAGLLWTLENARRFQLDPSKLALGGLSAYDDLGDIPSSID